MKIIVIIILSKLSNGEQHSMMCKIFVSKSIFKKIHITPSRNQCSSDNHMFRKSIPGKNLANGLLLQEG